MNAWHTPDGFRGERRVRDTTPGKASRPAHSPMRDSSGTNGHARPVSQVTFGPSTRDGSGPWARSSIGLTAAAPATRVAGDTTCHRVVFPACTLQEAR